MKTKTERNFCEPDDIPGPSFKEIFHTKSQNIGYYMAK